jgi:hypothetical protein
MRPTPIAVVLASTAALSAAPASAAALTKAPEQLPPSSTPVPSAQGDHCLAEAVTVDEMRRGVASEVTCYDTYAEALRAAGVQDVPSGITPAQAGSVLQAQSFVLGTHYDGANGGGQSISGVGDACDGRVLNLVGDNAHMNNRISSTTHGACPRIKHFTEFEMQGTAEMSVYDPGQPYYNLSASLNNQASSLRYLQAAN